MKIDGDRQGSMSCQSAYTLGIISILGKNFKGKKFLCDYDVKKIYI